MTFRYGYTVEGTTVTLRYRHKYDDGTYASFTEAAVRVLDSDDQRLSTFATDATAEVDADDDTIALYTFEWGSDAGQLPAITETLERKVVWACETADGPVVSDAAPWEHRHQRGQ